MSAEKPLVIVELKAENIKKLKAVRITPKGNLVTLTGKNGSGKTSVLDAIAYALEGLEGAPSHIIRQGAKDGFIDVNLGEFLVSRTFTASGTNLVIKDKAGARLATPQKLLDKLMSHLGFDPFVFMRMEPKKQAEALREIVELDTSAMDEAITKDYNERRDVRRDKKNIEAQLEDMEAPLPDLPAELIDLTSIADKLQVAIQHNTAVDAAKKQIEDMERSAKTADDNAHARRAHIAQLQQAIKDDEAAEQKAMQEAEMWRARAAEVSVHKPQDTTAINEELKNAEATNSQIRKRNAYKSLDDRRTALAESDRTLTDNILKLEKEKKDAIAGAKFPISGLGFENSEVMYNELPLAQASSAEQLRVSVAIAMAANPRLRVIRISDGSLLDPDSLEIICQMAEAGDYQVWIERVDTSGEVGIVLEDGEVVKVNAAPERPAPKPTRKKAGAGSTSPKRSNA